MPISNTHAARERGRLDRAARLPRDRCPYGSAAKTAAWQEGWDAETRRMERVAVSRGSADDDHVS